MPQSQYIRDQAHSIEAGIFSPVSMNQSESCGKVYLVGAGPGDPGLIWLRSAAIPVKTKSVVVTGGWLPQGRPAVAGEDRRAIAVGVAGRQSQGLIEGNPTDIEIKF